MAEQMVCEIVCLFVVNTGRRLGSFRFGVNATHFSAALRVINLSLAER